MTRRCESRPRKRVSARKKRNVRSGLGCIGRHIARDAHHERPRFKIRASWKRRANRGIDGVSRIGCSGATVRAALGIRPSNDLGWPSPCFLSREFSERPRSATKVLSDRLDRSHSGR
jgi:hypothetical protein